MAFEESGIPLVLRAYLTPKGKELLLSGSQNSRVKFFSLSDVDTNYKELSIDLENGLVPSVTGFKCLTFRDYDVRARLPVKGDITVDKYSFVFKKNNQEYNNINVKVNIGNYFDFLEKNVFNPFDINFNIYQSIYDFIFIKKESTNILGQTNITGIINDSNFYFDFNTQVDRENYKKINNYFISDNTSTLSRLNLPFRSPFILTPTHRNINNNIYHGAGSLTFFYYPYDRYGYMVNGNTQLLFNINAIETNYSNLTNDLTTQSIYPTVSINNQNLSAINVNQEYPDNNGSNDTMKRWDLQTWKVGREMIINFFESISQPSEQISNLVINMKAGSVNYDQTIDNGNITINFSYDKNPLNWNQNNPIIEYL